MGKCLRMVYPTTLKCRFQANQEGGCTNRGLKASEYS